MVPYPSFCPTYVNVHILVAGGHHLQDLFNSWPLGESFHLSLVCFRKSFSLDNINFIPHLSFSVCAEKGSHTFRACTGNVLSFLFAVLFTVKEEYQ